MEHEETRESTGNVMTDSGNQKKTFNNTPARNARK